MFPIKLSINFNLTAQKTDHSRCHFSRKVTQVALQHKIFFFLNITEFSYNISAHVHENKYLTTHKHWVTKDMHQQHIKTIFRLTSKYFSKLYRKFLSVSLPYRQMFSIKTIFKKQTKYNHYPELWEDPRKLVLPLTKHKHTWIEGLFRPTEKSNVVFNSIRLVHKQVCVQFQTWALKLSSFLSLSILLPVLYF